MIENCKLVAQIVLGPSEEESISSYAGLTFGQLLSSHEVFTLGFQPPRQLIRTSHING
jgi:hypothetical protein